MLLTSFLNVALLCPTFFKLKKIIQNQIRMMLPFKHFCDVIFPPLCGCAVKTGHLCAAAEGLSSPCDLQ